MKIIILMLLFINFPINVNAVEVLEETEFYAREVEGAFLKKLEISGFEISPIFDKMNNDYTLNIPNNINKLDINAEAYYEGSRIQIVGNNYLDYGENFISIKVTFESDVQEYKIIVNREQEVSVINYIEEKEETINSIYKDNYLIAILVTIVSVLIILLAIIMFKKRKR